MFVRLAFSLLWVILTGFLLISIVLKDSEDYENIGLRLWLGIGVGFGLASIHFFLWRLVTDPKTYAFIFGEIIILVLALVAYLWKLQPQKNFHLFRIKNRVQKPSFQAIIFFIISGIAVFVHLTGYLKTPQGEWDAWAIWNQHARFLIQDAELWIRVFSPLQQHPDYPMLLPANVARSWIYMGKESSFAPALIGATFTFSILGLLVTGVSRLRQPKLGYLAGILLMGAPAFHVSGLAQYADFPFAYYILAALILFNLCEKCNHKNQHLFMLGFFAGLSAWTKNEGWLFIAVLITARLLVLLFVKNKGVIRREALAFLVGSGPVILLLIFYNTTFTPTNDLVSGQGIITIQRILTPLRHLTIIEDFISQIYLLNTKHSIPFIALLMILLIFGVAKENFRKTCVLTTILVPVLLVVGYYLIFLTTPQDLNWHLNTASQRLSFHVWPASILAVFLVIPLLSSPAKHPHIFP